MTYLVARKALRLSLGGSAAVASVGENVSVCTRTQAAITTSPLLLK